MNEELIGKIYALEANQRISLILGAAYLVLPKLEGDDLVFEKANQALLTFSEWVKFRSISSRTLYDKIDPLSNLFQRVQHDPIKKSAFESIVSALYYITWEADYMERYEAKGENIPHLPNDMNEVDEYDAIRCLEDAIDATKDSDVLTSWIKSKI